MDKNEVLIKSENLILILTKEELNLLPEAVLKAGIARAKCFRSESDANNPWGRLNCDE
jgi:hypothetical protein